MPALSGMPRYAEAVQAAINSQIATLQHEIGAASAAAPAAPETVRRAPAGEAATAKAPAPSDAAEEIVAALDQRIYRLEHVRDWIAEDNELAALIDKVIGNQVESAMRRQRRFSVFVNVVLLLAGWLLSLLATPNNIFHFLPHP
jgi:hypothetical protein